MKVPVSPPNADVIFREMMKKDPASMLKLLNSGLGSSDAKGRYLHWDKIRYIEPPADLTPEQHWCALKLARKAQYKMLPFVDKAGKPFCYLVTDTMQRILHRLDQDASGSIMMNKPITNPHTRDTYLVSSLMEEAITSSQVEGAATTRKVAKEMLREGRQPKDHSEQMIYNNYRAMNFVRENREDHLTKEMIFELHGILTEGTLSDQGYAGRLRTEADDIHVIDADGTTILHTPPKASELDHRLEVLCSFANQEETGTGFLHPLLKAMILHFMIGYDHPFVDGNGRTARALFYWYVTRNRYWLLEFLSISSVIKEAPQKYGKAYLYAETDDNDTTYFLVHQLDTLQKAVDRLYEYLARKSGEIEEAEKLLERTRLRGKLNHRQLALLEHALKNPGAIYTIEGHRNSHRISYQTARTDLLKLSEEIMLLRKRKYGNSFVFVVPVDIKSRLEGPQVPIREQKSKVGGGAEKMPMQKEIVGDSLTGIRSADKK